MVPETPEQLFTQIREIVDGTAGLLELERKIEDWEITINPDYAFLRMASQVKRPMKQ